MIVSPKTIHLNPAFAVSVSAAIIALSNRSAKPCRIHLQSADVGLERGPDPVGDGGWAHVEDLRL